MAEPARIVSRYAGVQLQDARERLIVAFTDKPKRGVKYCLRDLGFRSLPNGDFDKPMSTKAIFDAQHVCNEFYGAPDAE